MHDLFALITVDLAVNRLGTPSHVGDTLRGRSVLARTVQRVAQVQEVGAIVLVHEPGQDPLPLLADVKIDKPIHCTPAPLRDAHSPAVIASRKWSPAGWRGGLGGATCYDELLPASALVAALKQHKGKSALIVGGDWPLVDPGLCTQVIDLHLSDREALQMTFCQAPPGLCGIVAGLDLLQQFAENNTGFGRLLAYNPQRPQPDPIGRDVCVQIPPDIRQCARRFIYDLAASRAMVDALADLDADAKTIVAQAADPPNSLPRQMTLELTTQRDATGELVPQQYVDLNRSAIDLEDAKRIVTQFAARDDALLTLGGLGDALRYPQWRAVVDAAREAGVLGICIETDLLEDRDGLNALLDANVDVISVRINADTAATYGKTMLPDNAERFEEILDNIEYLLRNRKPQGGPGLPWIVPRLIKTAATLKDMETFFERWMTFCGQAVIEPAVTGLGLMPDFAPLDMSPPKRIACRQLPVRLTVHADGRAARCDQDWLAKGCAGNAAEQDLDELWQDMKPLRDAHAAGQWNELELCNGCREWHRP